ncbi:hypothetical protein L596_008816 [Steinernema carpocapsae]|uniref:Uncharacterized protein n=1 Tax=Steinernema carpocapsae TaxID=34508 RepID=A0A4U5PDL1_STECR|nr:hypothetical protein L596_008816 [Steinernema carpocapsae]
MRVHRWLQVFVILHLCNLLLCARHRPRGVGLIKLPFGVSDHRSGPYLPNLYIAGNKLYHKVWQDHLTQTVPDVSLPGQNKDFTGNVQFNPFTHMLGVTFNHDYGDSWGSGYALHGVNFHNLPLGKNFKDFASLPTLSTDGLYQPFSNSFIVGAEFDDLKFRSQAVALDIPIPALNEIFDFEVETLEKRDEEGTDIFHSRINFPIPGTDTRLPFKMHFFERANDPTMNFGHVLPNVNLPLAKSGDITDKLLTNHANPTFLG